MMLQILSFLSGGGQEFSLWIWAYLDPGSGSMLFQILIAGFLSALFCARGSYEKLRNAVFRNHSQV